MPGKLQHIKKIVFTSPIWRAFFSVGWTLLSGVLCSSFVAEISTPKGLDWSHTLRAPTFYGLIVLAIGVALYTRSLYRYETAMERFLDDEYCKAYMRSQCLPEAAERYKELIRVGQVGELERAMNEVKKVLR